MLNWMLREPMNKKNTKFIAAFFVTIVLVYFLWTRISNKNLLDGLLGFDWRFVVLAFGFYAATLLMRAIRFRIFLKNQIDLVNLLGIVAMHSFWNNVLPFRSGELSYLYLIKKSGRVTDGHNLASLVVARLFDAFTTILFFSIAAIFLLGTAIRSVNIFNFIFVASVAGFLLALFFLLVIFHSSAALFFDFISVRIKDRGFISIGRLLKKIGEATESFGVLRGARMMFKFAAVSFLVWLADCLSVWASLYIVGIKLGIVQAVFIAAFPVVAAFLPIQSPFGLGTFEGTIVMGLLFLGVPALTAVASSVVVHLEFLVFSSLAFLAAYWSRMLGGSQNNTKT